MDNELTNIENKEDYLDFLEKSSAKIVADLLHESDKQLNDERKSEIIESDESFQRAIELLDDEENRFSDINVPTVYGIIYENYEATIEYVDENYEIDKDQHPTAIYEDYIKHCLAYDIASMANSKIEDTIEEEEEQ